MRAFNLALIVLLSAAAVPAVAQVPADREPRSASEKAITTSDAFLDAHPDMKYRLLGQDEYRRKRWDRAMEDFRRAARYGDKPAQAMIGEMYWDGVGVAQDKATAYAWLDLAAERGYPFLLVTRERYWARMDEQERERALAVGEQLYAEYGDDVAKPRLERLLRRASRSATGSRTGAVGALTIMVPTATGMQTIDGSQFYADEFWEPALYWRWQDRGWHNPSLGEVSVGAIMAEPSEPSPE